MSAIFRAYNDWLAEFSRTDPARLKGIAMINLDDIEDAIRELERTARLGLVGAMITEYPAEDRRYDQPEYENFWAAAEALQMPLSLHTATRRQGKIRGAGPGTLRDEGVLSGIVDVRHDLLRSFRTLPSSHAGDCRIRAVLGAQRDRLDGLHLSRAPRR